jgi:hypothetical protein
MVKYKIDYTFIGGMKRKFDEINNYSQKLDLIIGRLNENSKNFNIDYFYENFDYFIKKYVIRNEFRSHSKSPKYVTSKDDSGNYIEALKNMSKDDSTRYIETLKNQFKYNKKDLFKIFYEYVNKNEYLKTELKIELQHEYFPNIYKSDKFKLVSLKEINELYYIVRGKLKAFHNINDEDTVINDIVLKKKLNKDSKIIYFGDYHSSVHSLITAIENLQKNGILDNEYKLKKDYYIVFLGDLVDRGPYGIELLYIVLLLFLINNENEYRLFILNGNHEEKDIYSIYGLANEMNYQFNSNQEDDNELNNLEKNYSEFNSNQEDYNNLEKILFYLPLALFIKQDDNEQDDDEQYDNEQDDNERLLKKIKIDNGKKSVTSSKISKDDEMNILNSSQDDYGKKSVTSSKSSKDDEMNILNSSQDDYGKKLVTSSKSSKDDEMNILNSSQDDYGKKSVTSSKSSKDDEINIQLNSSQDDNNISQWYQFCHGGIDIIQYYDEFKIFLSDEEDIFHITDTKSANINFENPIYEKDASDFIDDNASLGRARTSSDDSDNSSYDFLSRSNSLGRGDNFVNNIGHGFLWSDFKINKAFSYNYDSNDDGEFKKYIRYIYMNDRPNLSINDVDYIKKILNIKTIISGHQDEINYGFIFNKNIIEEINNFYEKYTTLKKSKNNFEKGNNNLEKELNNMQVEDNNDKKKLEFYSKIQNKKFKNLLSEYLIEFLDIKIKIKKSEKYQMYELILEENNNEVIDNQLMLEENNNEVTDNQLMLEENNNEVIESQLEEREYEINMNNISASVISSATISKYLNFSTYGILDLNKNISTIIFISDCSNYNLDLCI